MTRMVFDVEGVASGCVLNREGLQSSRYSRELFLKSRLTLQVKKLAPIWGPILLRGEGGI